MSAQDGAITTTPAKPKVAATDVVDIGEQVRLAARRRELILSFASPIGLLIAWEIAGRFGYVDVRFFPVPSSIILVMVRMVKSGELLEHVLISLQRISLGFLLGGIPAIIIGITM